MSDERKKVFLFFFTHTGEPVENSFVGVGDIERKCKAGAQHPTWLASSALKLTEGWNAVGSSVYIMLHS